MAVEQAQLLSCSDEEAGDAESRAALSQQGVRSRAVAAAAALAVAALLAAGVATRPGGLTRWTAAGRVSLEEGDSEDGPGEGDDGDEAEAAPSCARPDGECTQSRCCVSGGESGYQCYAKNDGWAQCMDGCEEGVHEGETEGSWDASGTFQKASWSCEKLGERSLAGCSSFKSKKKCDADRCSWENGACTDKCSLFTSADACSTDQCTWESGECKKACEAFANSSVCDFDRCEWRGEKCIKACWKFDSSESCDKSRCIWGDEGCADDPCSAPGEDCSKTKCCSASRGGKGMTCFKKDKTWSSCSEECTRDSEEGKWDCTALGNRTPDLVDCTWAGDDCSQTKCCNNDGFACIRKDWTFAGCQQTVSKTTWVKKNVEVPADWDGTVLGYGRGECEFTAAADGAPAAGTSLYCFVAVLPNSTEVDLMNVAKNRNAGMYACDEHDLFHSWNSGSAGWDTGEATLVNTDVFINVFEQVKQKGTYLKHDWSIKADADCVFVPDRIRSHLQQFNPPASTALYVKNNGMDPDLGNHGFLGAIEVFSKKAMQKYFDNAEGCKAYFGLGCGEDGFFKGCMDALGACFVPDYEMFFPDNGAGGCLQGQKAAFHPLKTVDKWNKCLDLIEGKASWQQDA